MHALCISIFHMHVVSEYCYGSWLLSQTDLFAIFYSTDQTDLFAICAILYSTFFGLHSRQKILCLYRSVCCHSDVHRWTREHPPKVKGTLSTRSLDSNYGPAPGVPDDEGQEIPEELSWRGKQISTRAITSPGNQQRETGIFLEILHHNHPVKARRRTKESWMTSEKRGYGTCSLSLWDPRSFGCI